MPQLPSSEVGLWIAIIIAIYPMFRSLGDGISAWLHARAASKTDAADKLSKNSLEWVDRFSAELKQAKDRVDALEEEINTLKAEGKQKDRRIEVLEQKNEELELKNGELLIMIQERDERIAEMQKEITRLQDNRVRKRIK